MDSQDLVCVVVIVSLELGVTRKYFTASTSTYTNLIFRKEVSVLNYKFVLKRIATKKTKLVL